MLVAIRRASAAALLGVLLVVLGGCGLLTSADERARDEAHAALQERLDSVHESFVHTRSRDPYSTGFEALRTLDRYGGYLGHATDGDTVVLLLTIAAHGYASEFAAPAAEFVLGACVEVRIVAGSGGDDRGEVSTEPVSCLGGTDVEDAGDPANALTTDLDGHSAAVPAPEPDRPVCLSGQVCTEGGG